MAMKRPFALFLAFAVLMVATCPAMSPFLFGGFTYNSIPGLMMGFDASLPKTISLSGANVTQWNDFSGNGHNVSQATGANQPTFSSNAFLGHPAISFSGATVLSGSTFVLAQPFTVAIVGYVITPVANGRPWESNSGNPLIFNFATTNFWSIFSTGGTFVASTSTLTTSPHLAQCIFNGTSSDIIIDGTTNAITTGGTGGCSGTFDLGNDNSTHSSSWSGPLSLLLVYGHALTVNEQQRLRAYVKVKWGTP